MRINHSFTHAQDQKYGFGGKKRDRKRNTADSAGDLGAYRVNRSDRAKRPGKSRRKNMRARQ